MANFNNKRKKYYRIDYDTETDAIFSMFDDVGSETESDIEELLNDSDTEFIAEEEVLPIDENDRLQHHHSRSQCSRCYGRRKQYCIDTMCS